MLRTRSVVRAENQIPLKFFAFVLLFSALVSLSAHAQGSQQPPVTPGDPRAVYVVVLNHEKGAEPEFDKGGAKQLARWSNRVVVELPPAALAAMLKHGRVKYVQHLNNGPVKATAPSPERTSASFVPKALTGGGTLNWTTGDYHYDGSGNIDRVGADSSGNTRRFVYDEIDRLVEAGVEAPMAAPGTYTNYSRYTYDSFGNRLSEQTPAINATVVADRATNRITLPGTIVTYDGVGNMTQGGGLIYQYDPFNNLKEVDNWSGVQKMSIYNANDERIIFCGDGSSGPCRWTLRGNGNEVLREYESGPIGNGNSFWSYYLWVEDSVYRGTFLAGAQREAAEGGRLDFHLDHLGSPRLTTNAAGQQVTANEFAPFGRELTSIMQETQLGYDRTETHRFTGHERDFVEGTGSETVNFIDYMHARTYTPVFGRFLSVDPGGMNPSAPQTWNRYSYVANNPMKRFDPDGRNWFNINGEWEWHRGSSYTLNKHTYTSDYTHLMVVTATGQKNKSGAAIFNVTLYNQNKVAFTGTAWSGSSQSPRVPAHNYLIHGDNQVPPPTTVNRNSSVWQGNPPAMWGIQQMPKEIDGFQEQASYGPIRARLNPIPYARGAYDGAYYHGQDNDVTFGSSHGCLCYGRDTSIIQYIWDKRLAVPVAVDMPVQQP